MAAVLADRAKPKPMGTALKSIVFLLVSGIFASVTDSAILHVSAVFMRIFGKDRCVFYPAITMRAIFAGNLKKAATSPPVNMQKHPENNRDAFYYSLYSFTPLHVAIAINPGASSSKFCTPNSSVTVARISSVTASSICSPLLDAK